MEPHAEHQEHDADFRRLLQKALVDRRKARNQTGQDARQDVPHQGRRPQEPLRKVAEGKREAEARHEARQKRQGARHGVFLSVGRPWS